MWIIHYDGEINENDSHWSLSKTKKYNYQIQREVLGYDYVSRCILW